MADVEKDVEAAPAEDFPAPASKDASPASKDVPKAAQAASASSTSGAEGVGGQRKGIQRASLTEDDIKEFREIFNLVDTDGSGAISTEELGVLVESVGMKLTPTELQEMVNELDGDQSGEIEFDEFIGILSKDLSLDYGADEITSAFKMFARNAPPGLIRMSDLEEALRVYLKKVDPSEINELLRNFDDCAVYLSSVVDSDGMPVPFFRYQDYISLMLRK